MCRTSTAALLGVVALAGLEWRVYRSSRNGRGPRPLLRFSGQVKPRPATESEEPSSHLLCTPLPGSARHTGYMTAAAIDGWMLHVHEVEVLQAAVGTGAPAVLNVLGLFVNPTAKHGGVQVKGRTIVATIQVSRAKALARRVRCVYGEGHESTQPRVIFGQDLPKEKIGVVVMMLQCAIPASVSGATGPRRTAFSVMLEPIALRFDMCATPQVAEKHVIVSCSAHQYENRFGVPGFNTSMLAAWMEYHLLAGIGHMSIADRDSPRHEHVTQPYVAAGLASYVAHDSMPWTWWARTLQMFHNTACYMRNRHRAEWIVTMDTDELIDVRDAADGSSVYLPAMLDALPPEVTQVNLVQCALVTLNLNGTAEELELTTAVREQTHSLGLSSSPTASPLLQTLVLRPQTNIYRRCESHRQYAPKSIGRAADIGLSFIHYVAPPQTPSCDWRWRSQSRPKDCTLVALFQNEQESTGLQRLGLHRAAAGAFYLAAKYGGVDFAAMGSPITARACADAGVPRQLVAILFSDGNLSTLLSPEGHGTRLGALAAVRDLAGFLSTIGEQLKSTVDRRQRWVEGFNHGRSLGLSLGNSFGYLARAFVNDTFNEQYWEALRGKGLLP